MRQQKQIEIPCLSSESGSAVIEFVGFGVLLQVPLLVLATSFVAVQREQIAVEAISRQAARSYVLNGRDETRVKNDISQVISDFHIAPSELELVITDNCVTTGFVRIESRFGRQQSVVNASC